MIVLVFLAKKEIAVTSQNQRDFPSKTLKKQIYCLDSRYDN